MTSHRLSTDRAQRSTHALQAALIVTSMIGAACTTAMYNGPRPPAEEIAVIGSKDTRINYVDGKWVRDDVWAGSNAKYELLPGLHAIGISLELRTSQVIYTKIQYSKTITLCFEAQAGVRYQTIPVFRGKQWAPMIIEHLSGDSVGVPCRIRRQSADPGPSGPTSPVPRATALPMGSAIPRTKAAKQSHDMAASFNKPLQRSPQGNRSNINELFVRRARR